MANASWCALFKQVRVQVLAGRSSDHKPLLIGFAEEFNNNITCRRGSKFEARWLLDEELDKVIKEA